MYRFTNARAAVPLLAAALLMPTTALPGHGTSSHNADILNVPINFSDADIGRLVETMVDQCNLAPTTQMANGPFRRVSNEAAPTKNPIDVGGVGDARLDYVVWDSANAMGNLSNGVTAVVSGNDIDDQIGVDPTGVRNGIALRAMIDTNSNTLLELLDTTPTASQILDAGPGVGGVDAVMLIKNGTPKTARIICDMNMWFEDATPEGFSYGVWGVPLTDVVNRALLFWAMGPSPFPDGASISAACNAVNANGAVPGPGDDPSDPTETGLEREVLTVGIGADGVRFFGDAPLPASYTSCGGLAAYCDETEPTPDTDAGEVSGNACNPEGGSSSPPAISVINVNEGNASCVVSKYGFTMRLDPCPPE